MRKTKKVKQMMNAKKAIESSLELHKVILKEMDKGRLDNDMATAVIECYWDDIYTMIENKIIDMQLSLNDIKAQEKFEEMNCEVI